ncbi:hypothetical protein [Poseidonocella sp. HB161398]|uniref:dioxygenase family protein n=1 Tax=Poseidonocella sp. HB161398 TaxID=2320855 RepID=UPI001107D1F4|nr:hypothetical protein [Poseidonocella sp. HB161398]
MSHSKHDHDLGFAHDLPRMLGRRRLLAMMGGLGLGAASGLPAAAASCVALPWETAGPYPADGSNARDGETLNALAQEGILRSDLRGSFGEGQGEAEGALLELELTLLDADGCTPLAGRAAYVWHCNAIGDYSLYDVPEANWLRGLGVADGDGKLRFTTIVPGCYDGRWPHIHFEVFESAEAAVAGTASVLTAQIAMPGKVVGALYEADARYSNGTRNLGRITIPTDNVFGDNSEAELAQQTLVMAGDPSAGYRGTVTVPVDFTADRSTSMAPPPDGMEGDAPPPPGGFDGSAPPPRPDGTVPPPPRPE